MQKREKTAIVITILVTVAYAIYLVLVKNVPTENTVALFQESLWSIKLPFQVSAWWNLLLGPLMVLLIAYGYNKEEIIGDEPKHGASKGVKRKYEARFHIYMMNLISGGLAIASASLMAIVWLIVSHFEKLNQNMGPASNAVNFLALFFVCYVGLGIALQVIYAWGWYTIVDDYPDDEEGKQNLFERFSETFTAFIKLGIIKSLPFLIGLVLGFSLRLFFRSIGISVKAIFNFFRRIKLAPKNGATA
ncbi:MAG: hypothetical protein NT165_01605 [Candidatus Falkowbacteria bacterium]|nr:hypothetical protein [Candidatus Falkowbacteria bacterium]